jgi:hypothetical protein
MDKAHRAAAVVALGILAGSSVPASADIDIDVDLAPPPARVEVEPAPRPNHVWARGYWRWDSATRDYVWVPGHWIEERPGERWVVETWEPRGSRWHFVPGHWER